MVDCTHLEDDGFSFQFGHVLENGVDEFEKFITMEDDLVVFGEVIDEIVQ